jgi:hypothetical protein
MSKKILITLIAIVLILIALLIWGGLWSSEKVDPNLEAFAKCLAEKNITMYGAYWCASCKEEKAAFGSAFEYVNYFECAQDPKKCFELGVEYLPTWIFPDGKKFVGYQNLEQLAQESGCPLPQEFQK